jgi:hypothetical protein
MRITNEHPATTLTDHAGAVLELASGYEAIDERVVADQARIVECLPYLSPVVLRTLADICERMVRP